MTDRLYHELLAVPGLEQVTALQLQELAWKTKELIFVALFEEHASSSPVADELRLKSRDRRLERKTEKAENAERDVVRKNEERFRAEFMQIAATELSRLGAPAMITWQKLVFDRDCCAQAFRILLTKIKSAKRSTNNNSGVGSSSSVRRPIALAKRFATPEADGPSAESEEWGGADATSDVVSVSASDRPPISETMLPRIPPSGLKSTVKPRSGIPRRLSASTTSDWNADTTVGDSTNREIPDERLEDDPRAVPFGSAEISIQRTTIKPNVSASTSAFAAKLKKNQLSGLQQENAAMAKENAALRSEIAHLEALVATLQADNNQAATTDDGPSTHHARMKLLHAQNMQLQRQIGLLQDAMAEHETAESMLLTVLSHWREIVAAGRDEAKATGADTQAKAKDGKPVQWMLAVPERLLEELARVESQIDHAKKTTSLAQEAKLRVGGIAADFLKHSSTTSSSVPFSAVYVPGIAHLRVERVKSLEAALVQVVRSLESMHEHIVMSMAPKVMANGTSTNNGRSGASAHDVDVGQLLSSLRSAAVEVGAFGVVVPSAKSVSHTSDDDPLVTVADVLRAYVAAGAPASGVSAKEREKQLKAMLKQLQASEAAAQRARNQLDREATFWKGAWAMQEQLVRTLVQRVRGVGDKKMQWAESYLVHPLRELQEVWSSFQRTQQAQQDQRIPKNAYLPLLIDTIQRHEPVVCLEAIDQWQQYATRYNHEITEIFADYDANCVLLKSYIDAPKAS